MHRQQERNASREIDRAIERDRKAREKLDKEPKILILGSSDCGKSTLLKQFRILHGAGFSAAETQAYKAQMVLNVVESVTSLVKAVAALDDRFDTVENEKLRDLVLAFRVPEPPSLPSEIASAVQTLWNDTAIQRAWKKSHEYSIQDTADYFLSKATEIASPDYKPSTSDILHTRLPTDAITETTLQIGAHAWHFFDVGGMVKQRKHWIPYFDGVHSIMFVVSLASYNQQLEDDPTINRMADAIALFDLTINHERLAGIPVILFMNKKDLFKAKIQRYPVVKYFPDFIGREKYDQACKMFANKFCSQNATEGRPMFVHFTRATDTQAMDFVIKAVMESLLHIIVKSSGLF
ncbi:guanine nucleotide binding protein, alpha subunit [Entophlyctis helioformis]|nr:guanine nucleotide binding protein, alpha subunit [Entophlyctis helioformis]